MPRPLAMLCSAALMLGVLAGCGADDGERDEGPTHAAYVARADAICRDTRTRAEPLLRRLAAGVSGLTPARARRLAPTGRRVHTLAGDYLRRISALERPEADRAAIASLLASTRQVVDAIGGAAAALTAGQTIQALATLSSVQTTADEANAIAARLGLDDCASVLSV